MTSPDELRERIQRAILDEAPVWEEQFDAGPGLVCGVPDAAVVASRVVTPELERRDAEMAQAVEDWGRNDEQMLAENQRLADENELLREELDKVSGGWEARVASRSALRTQLAAAKLGADTHQERADRIVIGLRRLLDEDRAIENGPAKPMRLFVGSHKLTNPCERCGSAEDWPADTATHRFHFVAVPPLRDSATSEASLEEVRPDTPPAAGEADTTPRVWRDIRGCEWEEVASHDELRLIRTDPSHCREVDGPTFWRRYVEAHYGPLVEVLPNTEQGAEK